MMKKQQNYQNHHMNILLFENLRTSAMVQTQRHTLRDRRPITAALPTVPSLLGDGDKGIEIVSVREKYFVLGRLEQPRQNKNLLYWHDKRDEPTKKGPLSFVLFESPSTSVSTISRGHPSLDSLDRFQVKISLMTAKLAWQSRPQSTYFTVRGQSYFSRLPKY
jgi:hypothetical protein